MIRSLAALLVALLAAGAVVGLAYGASGGVQTAELLAAVGALGLLAAHASAAVRTRLSLRAQLAAALALALGTVLAATIAGALLMFVSGHDAVIVAVIVVFGAALGARAAALLSEGMVARLTAEEARAAAAEQARRDLIAGASHDLRTPVAALRLILEALQDDLVDEPTRRRYLATMTTHIRSLGGLIDDLFELTRMQAGEIAWSLQRVRLSDLVDETVQALEPAAQSQGVRLQAELSDPTLTARADPERLQRVLFNLVQNAIRHTPADGSVRILAGAGASGVELEVADTGGGIPAAERERVFEPFYRGEAAGSRSGDGAGLGLAICRAIVEAHGGRIWVDPDHLGTRVRLTLPA